MKNNKMENICKNILARLTEKKRIDEDLVNGYLGEIAGEMTNSENAKKESCFRKLKGWVYETWQYGDVEEMSREQTFLLGALWGGMKIKEAQCAYVQRQDSMDIMVQKYKKYVWFFKAIHDNPGIIHKDLAAKGNESPAQLSQFVSGVSKDGLITYNRIGREKFYYLQTRGEELLKEIKKQGKSVAGNNVMLYKTMLKNNIHESDEDVMKGILPDNLPDSLLDIPIMAADRSLRTKAGAELMFHNNVNVTYPDFRERGGNIWAKSIRSLNSESSL